MAWTYDNQDWARVNNGRIELKNADGSWSVAGTPEHAESLGYVTAAANSPEVDKLIAYARAGGALNAEQQSFLANPLLGMDSYGQGSRWGGALDLFDNQFSPQQAGALSISGLSSYLTPEQLASGQQFVQQESPAAQSARDDDGGLFGGDFGTLLTLAALGFGGYSLLSGLGGAGASSGAGLAEGFGGAGMLGDSATWGLGNTAAAGTTAGSGSMGLWDSITNGLSNMFSSGASDIAPNLVGSDAIETMSNVMNATGTTTFGDAASALGYSSPVEMLGSINPAWISDAGSIANLIQKGGQAAKSLLGADGSGAKLLSGALTGVGSMLSGNAATSASKTAADAQIEAAKIAADAAKFRPVGVTTRFGNSNFTKDANGNVTGAGYQLTPDIKAQQDALIGAGNTMLPQFTGSVAATAPMGTAAGRMMELGNGYLSTDPLAQAKKYYDDQQAILAAGREREQAGMLTGEFNRGTYGLATGGTSTGMTAANPRLEAYYNSLRQQDLGLAADATRGGMDYAKFGSGMVGAGGDMLKGMYGVQTASYDPYKTAMGGAQTLEGLGQNSMDMGVNLGRTTSNAASGQLLANGMMAAANTMQPANAYSPWGAMLTGAGNAVQSYTSPQANSATYDPTKFQLVPFGS